MCGVNLQLLTYNCFMCNEDTNCDGYDQIEDRKYYVEGKGRLCSRCWDAVFARYSDE